MNHDRKISLKYVWMEKGECIGELSLDSSKSFLGKNRMIKLSNNIRLVTNESVKRISLPFGIFIFINKHHKDKSLNEKWHGDKKVKEIKDNEK